MRGPKPDEYNRLEEITTHARAKAPHFPMPPELKAEFDEDADTLPMFQSPFSKAHRASRRQTSLPKLSR